MTSLQNHPALIALGSNLGDRMAHLRLGFDGIAALPGCRLLMAAVPIETDPVGPAGQGAYLNSAAVIRTTLPPRDLLEALLGVERTAGRDRSAGERWGPRTLDLDLILYGDATINEPGLVVPHPLMHERGFVLRPAAAVAGDWRHPVLGRTVAELLRAVEGSEG